MAEYNARIRQKRDTSANWTAKDPILLDGEIIIVDTASGSVRKKVGDGTKKYVANKIYIQTIAFLSRLSSRYSRLVSKSVSELASEVVDHAEKANSIYPSDTARKELRKQHLLEARASLMALDVHLAHCYDLMMTNPSGCFTTGSGNSVGASDAKKKLEHMAQELGDLIDAENGLLTNVLKSDKSR